MYEKYSIKNTFSIDFIPHLKKTNTIIKITGKNALELLKKEHGIHKVTRVSPFGNGKLHTSTVKVHVSTNPTEEVVNIDKKDLIYEPFKSTGCGGQHRNKTESAIRLTHKPTGIVCISQNSRCQHENKRNALEQLNEKLNQQIFNNNERDKEYLRNKSLKTDTIVRSYYLNHNLIVDEKTKLKTKNVKSYLNGNLEFNE